jgi:type IV pilus assembly protein PilN
MLHINLLPVREARRQEDVRQLLMQGTLMLLLLGAGVGFVYSKISEEIGLSNARIQQMQSDIDQYKPQLEQVAVYRARKSELETKINVIDELDKARSGPVRVLSELAERVPERLWLTSLSTQGKEIRMEGRSLDNDLVAVFLRALTESEYFDQVDLDKTELGGNRGGLRLVSFSIRAQLVSPGSTPPADAV